MNNIADILSLQAKNIPGSIAIRMTDRSFTYKELDDLVWKSTAFLYYHGIRAEDVIALRFKNEFNHIVFMFAVARMGATVFSLPVNAPSLASAQMFSSTNTKILLTDIADTVNTYTIAELLIDMSAIEKEPLTREDHLYVRSPKALWQIIAGSGSTGKMKLIPLSHQQQIIQTEISKSGLHIANSDLVASFIDVTYPDTKRRLLETFFSDASFLILDSNTPRSITLYKQMGVTILRATVFHMEQLLRSAPKGSKDILGFLKTLSVGTAALSDDLRKRIYTYLTPNLYITYGTNETGTVSAASFSEVFNLSGTVGHPFEKVTMEIVDKNDIPLPSGKIGQIRIMHPGMAKYYLYDDKATNKAFRNGWFYPGDLGKLTGDGQLVHMGRADHMMIMNGINIYPAEIEQVITSHPDVTDAAAMPISSSVHQEIPLCAVVLSPESETTEKELLEYSSLRLGARAPRRVFIVNEIPRNEQGKLIRKSLGEKMMKRLSGTSTSDTPSDNCQKQTLKPFTIHLSSHTHVPLEQVDRWLSGVLRIPVLPLPRSASAGGERYAYPLALSWRILLLTQTLLQAIRIPIFCPGSIKSLTDTKNLFKVTVEVVHVDHIPQHVYLAAFQTASRTIMEFFQKEITEQHREILFHFLQKEFLAPLSKISGSGKSTLPILKQAYKKNIPFRHLQNGIYQLGWGSRSKRMNRSITENDSLIGGVLTDSKILTASLVYEAGLPAPEHYIVNNPKEAAAAAEKLGWPLVAKPSDQDRGEGVTIGINDHTHLIKAFTFARNASKAKKVLIERQVDGVCCRIFIADGEMLYAVKRLPKSVKGDGIHTVRELIDRANNKEQSLPPWQRTEPFPLDEMARDAIHAAGLTLESIPGPLQHVPLRAIESTRWGGVDEDVSASIHPDNIDLAIRAAGLFGLYVAGVDIISPDITRPWHKNGAIVNEVNFSPLFGGGEISRRTIPHFLERYVVQDGRIPVTIVVGADEAMRIALKVQNEEVSKGLRSFVSSHSKTLSWENKEVHLSFESLYERCRALLLDKRVDSLILVVSTDEFLHSGLPVDHIVKLLSTDEPLQSHSDGKQIISDEMHQKLMLLLKQHTKFFSSAKNKEMS